MSKDMLEKYLPEKPEGFKGTEVSWQLVNLLSECREVLKPLKTLPMKKKCKCGSYSNPAILPPRSADYAA